MRLSIAKKLCLQKYLLYSYLVVASVQPEMAVINNTTAGDSEFEHLASQYLDKSAIPSYDRHQGDQLNNYELK